MKLASIFHRTNQKEYWGKIAENGFAPFKFMDVYPTLLSWIQSGREDVVQDEMWDYQSMIPLDEIQILPPIQPTKNILCVGKNYAEHAKEMSGGDASQIPEHPLFFTKSPTSVIGHLQMIESYPHLTQALDYEGELLVVIGKKGRDIPESDAMDYIFGYSIINDVTARDLQKRHQQYFKGKSLDTFAPIGPYIVPKSFLPHPDHLKVRTYVNGELRQDGQTKDMIFSIPKLIHILSQGMTLEPGDLIATGTPSGVGQGFNPPRYLKMGDEVRIVIDGIGELINHIK